MPSARFRVTFPLGSPSSASSSPQHPRNPALNAAGQAECIHPMEMMGLGIPGGRAGGCRISAGSRDPFWVRSAWDPYGFRSSRGCPWAAAVGFCWGLLLTPH